jgi:hypothetical protein
VSCATRSHQLPHPTEGGRPVALAEAAACEACTPTPVTRRELIERAQAHLDRAGRTRTLTAGHYRQAVSICRQHGLATEDEILQAHRRAGTRPRTAVA